MTGITTYLSTLTLNINRFNSPIMRHHWHTGFKRKIQKSVAYWRPISSMKQVLVEDERLEEDLPSKWPLKTGRSSSTYLRQSRLQTYIDQKR
jgi:hypothetical protein